MFEKFYNQTITLWNCVKSGIWDDETWYSTVFHNVRLSGSTEVVLKDKRILETDTVRVHLRDGVTESDKTYVPRAEYSSSVSDEYFTLSTGDEAFITLGDTSSESITPDFFGKMKASYDDCYWVKSFERYELIPHWEVICK